MTKDEALKLALEALEKLWNIIDDIDTYGDMAKADEKLYRSLVERRQRTRFEETGITTDGYELSGGAITAIKEALEQPEQDGKCKYCTDGCPACDARKLPEQTNTRPYFTIDELNAWADEKEKQAWRNAAIRIGEELSSVGPDGYYEMDAWKWLEWAMEQEPRGKNSLAQPEQKSVAMADYMALTEKYVALKAAQPEQERFLVATIGNWGRVEWADGVFPSLGDKMYSAPRTWVGLTDDEIFEIHKQVDSMQYLTFGHAIEAKLKEKNT